MNILDEIRLKQLAIKITNLHGLRDQMNQSLVEFTTQFGRPWQDVRPLATLVLTEASTIIDEGCAIIADLALLDLDAQAMTVRSHLANFTKEMVEMIYPVRDSMLFVIKTEDGTT